nr:hypothetical protein [Novosphingobium sp.]
MRPRCPGIGEFDPLARKIPGERCQSRVQARRLFARAGEFTRQLGLSQRLLGQVRFSRAQSQPGSVQFSPLLVELPKECRYGIVLSRSGSLSACDAPVLFGQCQSQAFRFCGKALGPQAQTFGFGFDCPEFACRFGCQQGGRPMPGSDAKRVEHTGRLRQPRTERGMRGRNKEPAQSVKGNFAIAAPFNFLAPAVVGYDLRIGSGAFDHQNPRPDRRIAPTEQDVRLHSLDVDLEPVEIVGPEAIEQFFQADHANPDRFSGVAGKPVLSGNGRYAGRKSGVGNGMNGHRAGLRAYRGLDHVLIRAMLPQQSSEFRNRFDMNTPPAGFVKCQAYGFVDRVLRSNVQVPTIAHARQSAPQAHILEVLRMGQQPAGCWIRCGRLA